MNHEMEIECWVYMLGLDGFDAVVDGIPYINLEPYGHDGHILSVFEDNLPEGWGERSIQPRVAVLGTGIFSPVKSPWPGWMVGGHFVLGEQECPNVLEDGEHDPDCLWCDGEELLYFGEDTIAVLLLPYDKHHDHIREHFGRALLASAYSQACDEWLNDGYDRGSHGGCVEPPMPGSGQDWMNYLPVLDEDNRIGCEKYVLECIREIESEWNMTLSQWLQTTGLDLEYSELVEQFGHYLAMNYVGHGVGLTDWAWDYGYKGEKPKIPYGDEGAFSDAVYDWMTEHGCFGEES